MKLKPPREEIVTGDEGAIAGFARVVADNYFVHVITDDYEGHAMFHVSVARKLIPALQRAIEHVESQQE